MKPAQHWRGYALRSGRHSEIHTVYVITTVTHQREPLFADIWLGRRVVDQFRRCERQAHTWAFVVMPDHFHWMFQLRSGRLSEVVKRVKGASAHVINGQLKRRKAVWQKGFYDQQIRDERHIRDAARYIVANPLRAGLVRSVADYPLWDAIWLE